MFAAAAKPLAARHGTGQSRGRSTTSRPGTPAIYTMDPNTALTIATLMMLLNGGVLGLPRKAKIKHRCGVPAIYAPKRAPVLDFRFFVL